MALLLCAGGAVTLAGCGDGGGGGMSGGDGGGTGGGSGGNGSDGGSHCSSAGDCRLFESYCRGDNECKCIPLRKDEVDPPCVTGHVSCLVAPCVQKVPDCQNDVCIAKMQ